MSRIEFGERTLFSRGGLSVLLAVVLLHGSGSPAPPGRPGGERGVTDVYVCFKTHFDIGYTDLVENVLKRYRVEMMEKALRLVEADRKRPPGRRFVWTVPGWPMKEILGPRQDPGRGKRVIRALAEGSFAVHALPATLHTGSLDYEDLVRGLVFSVEVARKCGLPPPIAAKMTDVPAHSWVLPTLLVRGGVKFLHLGCNPACRPPRFPRLFWWVGPDGSKLLTAYDVHYGSSLVPPPDWPSRNYLAMIMTSDNQGPPDERRVAEVRRKIGKFLPGVRVHVGTLDDFARAVLAENPDLPVVRADAPDTWIHGLMSMPEATKTARNVRPLEPALDILSTELRIWGCGGDSPAGALARAYEKSLLFGEHTWGMNGAFGGRNIWGIGEWKRRLPKERREKFLKSFADHRAYIEETARIVGMNLRRKLALLAESVEAPPGALVVYNALPWKRSGLVEIPDPGEGALWVEDVPACGYKVVEAAASPYSPYVERKEGETFETAFYRLKFDLDKGGISSLVEKETGREFVDGSRGPVLGQFLRERFGLLEVKRFFRAYSRMKGGWAWDDLGKPGLPGDIRYQRSTPSSWRLKASRSPVEDRFLLSAGDTKGLAEAVTLEFAFSRHSPWIQVTWTISGKRPWKVPEGGWLCFPFALKDPRFLLGRPGAPIDPAEDIIPGANRHMAAVMSGAAVLGEDGRGAALCPLDSPLLSLGETGLWKFSYDYVPRAPLVFVNVYNNQWNTNFPLWTEGSWKERVRLWPVRKGEDVRKTLAVRSWEARLPLLAAVSKGGKGFLPRALRGLSLSRKGVLVTAFGPDPYGSGNLLLRMWEQAGKSGGIRVELPEGTRASLARPVNLRGEAEGEPIRIRNGGFEFDLGAYAPASFLLEEIPREK